MLLPSTRIVALFRALWGPALAAPKQQARPGWERLIVWLAALVCLLFVSQLRDAGRPELAVPPELTAPAPIGAGQCEVRVVDGEGQPHPEAMVRLFHLDAEGQVFFVRDQLATGEPLQFAALPTGELWILAYGRGQARASTRLILGEAKASATLALVAAAVLPVRVVDDSGAPVSGIEVSVSGGDVLAHVAFTDPEGRAQFDRLGAAPFSVTAAAEGFDPVTRSGVFPGAPIEIKLERLGGFELSVLDVDGQPAPFAEILLSGPGIWPARKTVADAKGEANILGLYGGVYDLRARLGDKVSPTDFSVPLQKGKVVSRILQLEEGRYVTVRVTDGPVRDRQPNPAPVEDAEVVLVEEGLSAFPVKGRTNAEGVAILGPVSQGVATVTARAEGFMPRLATSDDVVDDDVTIPLLRGGTVIGDVRDERGFVVDGATILAIGTDTDGMPIQQNGETGGVLDALVSFAHAGELALIPRGELGVMPGPVPPIPRAAFGIGDAQADSSTWVSGRDGRFRVSPVTPGRVQLLVRHPEFIEELTEIFPLAPSEEREIKVVLKRGGRLEGRVVEEDRIAVAGARVEIAALEGTFEQLAYTDADGNFAAAAVPKNVLVSVFRAEAPGEVAARLSLSLDRERVERIEIVLAKPREATELRVVDTGGFPLSGVEVRAVSLDEEASVAQTLFSDDDGLVSVSSVRGLPLRVTLEKPGKASVAVEIAEALRDHKLVMPAGLVLRGQVTARDGRDRVEAADLVLFTAAGARHARSDVEGAFEVSDLESGRIRLVARHPSYAKVERVVWFEGDLTRPQEIDPIDLPAAGTVAGEIVDERGEPVVGARIGVGGVPTFLPVGRLPSGLAISDTDGRFILKQVPEGEVEIEAYSAELGRNRVAVTVVADRVTDRVRIELADQGYSARKLRAPGSVALTLAEREGRVVVLDVPEGGEGEYAGLEPEDVLQIVGGKNVTSLETARDGLGGPLGQDVIVSVMRALPKGSPITIRLRIRREAVRR